MFVFIFPLQEFGLGSLTERCVEWGSALRRRFTVIWDVATDCVEALLLLVKAPSSSSDVFVHGQRVAVEGWLRSQILEQDALNGLRIVLPAAAVDKPVFHPRTVVTLRFLLKVVTRHEVWWLEVIRIPSGHRVLVQGLVHEVKVREHRVVVILVAVIRLVKAAVEWVVRALIFLSRVNEVEVVLKVQHVALRLLYWLAHNALQHGALVALFQVGCHGVQMGGGSRLDHSERVIALLLLLRLKDEIVSCDIGRVIIIAVNVLLQVVNEHVLRARRRTASCWLLLQVNLQIRLIKGLQNSWAAGSFIGGRFVLVLLF